MSHPPLSKCPWTRFKDLFKSKKRKQLELINAAIAGGCPYFSPSEPSTGKLTLTK